MTEKKRTSDYDHDAQMIEAEDELSRELEPTVMRGREDDYWEPGQSVLDEVPDEMDSKDDPLRQEPDFDEEP
jgi:hypothetical protein